MKLIRTIAMSNHVIEEGHVPNFGAERSNLGVAEYQIVMNA